jgi:hypothetical protein
VAECSALTAEGIDNGRRHNSYPGRASQILMNNQPRGCGALPVHQARYARDRRTRSSLRRSAPGEIAVRGVERITLHAFRFLGLAFVIPGVVSSELPAAFAQPVAYGDLLTAILALLALAALRTRSGTTVTWVFNTFGTADLLFGFYLGSRISLPATPGLLGAGYFIVAAYVPLLLITHGLAFRILLRTKVVVPSRNKLSTA